MNLIKTDIESLLPEITWEQFTEDGDTYVTTYVPQFEKEEKRTRFLYLRDRYPTEYAAALNNKLPEGAKLISYDHMSLLLRVRRDD